MTEPITLAEMSRAHNAELHAESMKLMEDVKCLTRDMIYNDFREQRNHFERRLANYALPKTMDIGELERVSQPMVGFYLATLASPLDFAYTLKRRYKKVAGGERREFLHLCIGPRVRPWWRSFVDFPPTDIMTTEVAKSYFD